MNTELILGIDDALMQPFQSQYALVSPDLYIHQDVSPHLAALCEKAYFDGNKLALLSGYRSYQRQVLIWNEKSSGQRIILDDDENVVHSFKSNHEKYLAISRWSALPGLSRHHWGTDIDIFAANIIETGYHPQLTGVEFAKNGPCEKLNQWLQDNLSAYDFFRPYMLQKKPTTPQQHHKIKEITFEPWHISYLPIAKENIQYLGIASIKAIWSTHSFCAANWAIENIQDIYKLFRIL